MHKHTKKESVYNFLLDISKEIGRKKLGALFIIAKRGKFQTKLYELLYPQAIAKTSILDKGAKELIIKLAELDGSFLIAEDGRIVAFGARIKKSKALPGYGTKHAAAVGITSHLKNSTAILVSEETQWIKVFKTGKIILEIDSSKALSSSVNHKVLTFLTDNDTALLATAGASAAIMGLIPIVIVSGTYLAIKTASGIIKKNFE